jgi:hypothetical protein
MRNEHLEAMREATEIVDRNLGGQYETYLEWPGFICVVVAKDKQLMFGTNNETINADLNVLDDTNTWQFDESGCYLEYLTTKVDSNSTNAQEIAFAVSYATARYLEQFPHPPTAPPVTEEDTDRVAHVLPTGALEIAPEEMKNDLAYTVEWGDRKFVLERMVDGCILIQAVD